MKGHYILRLLLGLFILFAALIAWVNWARAQGGGYLVVLDQPPTDAHPWKDNRFWLTLNNGGAEETWLMNVAGYIDWDDRPTEYLILRVDNLQNLADLDDPICPTANSGLHPYLNVPDPTFFIWNESTLQPYIHSPC